MISSIIEDHHVPKLQSIIVLRTLAVQLDLGLNFKSPISLTSDLEQLSCLLCALVFPSIKWG